MTQHTSEFFPRTPEEAFCFAAAQVLAPWEIDEVLAQMSLLPLAGLNRHDLTNLTASIQYQASARARPDRDPMVTIRDVIRDPATRDRVRRYLVAAMDADPVDALADAELLVRLARDRLDGLHAKRG